MRRSMKFFVRNLIPTLLASACTVASSQTTQLTINLPECRMPPGKVLPDKYYKLANTHKDFKWVPQDNCQRTYCRG